MNPPALYWNRHIILSFVVFTFFSLPPVSMGSKIEESVILLHPDNIKVAQAEADIDGPYDSGALQHSAPEQVISGFTASDTTVQTPEILAIYKELFRTTYASAPDIRIAQAQLKQKSAERYTAWAKRLAPAVDARLRQVHEFDTDQATGNDIAKSEQANTYSDGTDYQDWGFTLDLPIYQRPVSLRVDIAQAEEQLAENNLIIKTQELDLRLREFLGNYLTASYRLLNLQESIRLSSEHVEKIYKGYELRDQTRLQLLRAQANLKELEARRDLDEQRRDSSFRALLDYTGLQAEAPVFQQLYSLLINETSSAGCINTLADLEHSYTAIQQFAESIGDEILRSSFRDHSLLYQKISLQHDLSNLQALIHTENEWPGLSLRGLYDRKEDTEFSDLDGEGSLAVVFSVPVFTGGTIFSNSKARSMAQHIADVTQYADLRETIHAIENNRKLIENLKKVYTTQQIHLQQQAEIVTLSLKSYTIKQTSMQDLLTSQNRLIDAKNALVETTNKLGTLYREFAWQLGYPFPVPSVEIPDTNN